MIKMANTCVDMLLGLCGIKTTEPRLKDGAKLLKTCSKYPNCSEKQAFLEFIQQHYRKDATTQQPKSNPTSQQANLGGNTEYTENENEESEYIKQLKNSTQPKPNPQPKHLLINKTELLTPKDQPKKFWLNDIAE